MTLPILAGSASTAVITRATFPRDVGAFEVGVPLWTRATVMAPVGSSRVSRPG